MELLLQYFNIFLFMLFYIIYFIKQIVFLKRNSSIFDDSHLIVNILFCIIIFCIAWVIMLNDIADTLIKKQNENEHD